MPVTIELPEEIERQLETVRGDLARRALEALAVEGYRSEALSAGQVAELLNPLAVGDRGLSQATRHRPALHA
jgi:hypothetical protein